MSRSLRISVVSIASVVFALLTARVGWTQQLPALRPGPPVGLGVVTPGPKQIEQPDRIRQANTTTRSSILIGNDKEKKARAQIEKKLCEQAEFQFQETPLRKIADYIQTKHHIPVLIDTRALDQVGMKADTPVTIRLSGVMVRSALWILLNELDLTYVIQNGVLEITTPDDAEQSLDTRLYVVTEFALPREPSMVPGRENSRLSEIAEAIRAIVAPNTWDEVGGAGTLVPLDSRGVLAIAQTQEVHRHVGQLLATLREARAKTLRGDQLGGPRVQQPRSMPVGDESDRAGRVKIDKALLQETTFAFKKTPLREVVEFIGKQHEIPVLIDVRALDDVGLGNDVSVTVRLKKVPLGVALRAVCGELDLTLMIRHEMLIITTPEEAENELETRVYRVADLVTSGPLAGHAASQCDELVRLITTIVCPAAWAEVGGAGDIIAWQPWGQLIISQTREVQRQIDELLGGLTETRSPDSTPSIGFPAIGLPPSPGPGMSQPMGMPQSMFMPGAMVVKVYPVGAAAREMAEAIEAVLAPDTPGMGPAQGKVRAVGNTLVVRQSLSMHREIQRLIDAVGALNARGPLPDDAAAGGVIRRADPTGLPKTK